MLQTTVVTLLSNISIYDKNVVTTLLGFIVLSLIIKHARMHKIICTNKPLGHKYVQLFFQFWTGGNIFALLVLCFPNVFCLLLGALKLK